MDGTGAGGGLQSCPGHLSLTLGPQVEFSMLNPNGPFVLLNPISKLLAGETQVLTLSFSPHESVLVSPRPTLHRAAAHVLRALGAAGPPRLSPLVGKQEEARELRAVSAPACPVPAAPSRAPAHASDRCLLHANGHDLHRPKKHWTSSPREARFP